MVLQFGQGGAQPTFAGDHADQFDLRPGEVDGGRHAVQALAVRTALQCSLDGDLTDEYLVRGRRPGPVFDSQRRARVALRIEVDHQCAQTLQRQGGRDVDRRGGLAYAALLIGDREHPLPRRAVAGGLPTPRASAAPPVPPPHRSECPRPARSTFHVKHRTRPIRPGLTSAVPPSRWRGSPPARLQKPYDHPRGRVHVLRATCHHLHLGHAQSCHRPLVLAHLFLSAFALDGQHPASGPQQRHRPSRQLVQCGHGAGDDSVHLPRLLANRPILGTSPHDRTLDTQFIDDLAQEVAAAQKRFDERHLDVRSRQRQRYPGQTCATADVRDPFTGAEQFRDHARC